MIQIDNEPDLLDVQHPLDRFSVIVVGLGLSLSLDLETVMISSPDHLEIR